MLRVFLHSLVSLSLYCSSLFLVVVVVVAVVVVVLVCALLAILCFFLSISLALHGGSDK
jgi:hypothetical protein